MRLALEHGGDGLLITFTTKHNLDNVRDLLVPIIGELGICLLASKGRLESELSLQIETDRTLSTMYEWSGPVLMVYPTETMLVRISEVRGITHEFLVPLALSEHIRTWSAAHRPTPMFDAAYLPNTTELDPC